MNTYFDEDEVEALEIPDDTSTSNDELTAKEGNYKIKLSEIYSGTFKLSDSNQIGIRVIDGRLYFTNLYKENEENQLINQLIATGNFNDLSSDGESLPTIEEFRNSLEIWANYDNVSNEEELDLQLISCDIISVVITQSVNGETTTLNNIFQAIDFVGNEGDENVYTITINSNNGKHGENTFTLVTPQDSGGAPFNPDDPIGPVDPIEAP